jgi:hypothetical protein
MDAPVELQATALRPLSAWTHPEDAWFYDTDGWVYYGQALQPGTMTPLLLESFSVGPESPLLKDETRYRLLVLVQSAPLDVPTVRKLWNTETPLNGLGMNSISNEAGNVLLGILEM